MTHTHPDDAPELTAEMMKTFKRVDPDSPLGKAMRGRPKSSNPKQPVTIRLDADIVAHFKAGGKGWQTRINDALHKVIAK